MRDPYQKNRRREISTRESRVKTLPVEYQAVRINNLILIFVKMNITSFSFINEQIRHSSDETGRKFHGPREHTQTHK